jgi:hypothetical protein
MMNDSQAILDDLLSRWHSHCRAYRANQQVPRDPMFRNTKSGRSWDSTDEIIEDEIHGSMMEAIDFQVSEMKDPYRAAIYALARNLSTGRSVWLSPRLPTNPLERATVVAEARNQITRRLMAVGVM